MRLLAPALALLLSACATGERPANHADWLREATRVWPGETQARLIAAAEAVVRHADPADTTLEYNKGGFLARRKFVIYAVIAAAVGEDRWTFAASENTEGASASIRVIQRGTAISGSSSERFRDNQTDIGGFRLFYARMEYLLGRRADWVNCQDAPAKLSVSAEKPGTDALCSLTLQSRDAPPPAKLPPRPKAGAAAPKGPPPPPVIQGDEAE
ncbi:MAG: hypothetical protein ACRC7C_07450 [Beijerinckiaceae bacterium]